MADIGVLGGDPQDREALSGLLGEMGHLAYEAGRLEEALEVSRERRPRAWLLVDGAGVDAETLARELRRAFPLLPVMVALKTRDARRAVGLMRVGAAEVVAPPWTPVELKASVSKTLRFQGTALSPLRVAPRRRSGLLFALAVGAFFAFALTQAASRRAEKARAAAAAVTHAWDLPVSHPAGLAFDGESVWVVDWFSQSLYAHSTKDAALGEVRHLTAETPVSAHFAGDSVWTIGADGTVARRMRDAKLTVLQRWPGVARNPAGIVFDGLYLWTLDGRARRLYKRLPDPDLTVAGVYRVPGVKPVGLAYDGKTLWTLDAADRSLRRHNLDRPDEAVELVPLSVYGDGKEVPTGLAFDGTRFWTSAEPRKGGGPARLRRHPEALR
ncbi:MAG: response regulator [Elusimicrobiota bacterium]|nr:response regulator [Elusimicrobiota bacterium]